MSRREREKRSETQDEYFEKIISKRKRRSNRKKINKKKKIIAILFIAALVIIGFGIYSILNPTHATVKDKIVEDIGGDGELVATFNTCLKIKEEDIGNGTFTTSGNENFDWKDGKNITYVNGAGVQNSFIVWKASPENYDFITDNSSVNYYSDYLSDLTKHCFMKYSPKTNSVYGIIINDETSSMYTENEILTDILNITDENLE